MSEEGVFYHIEGTPRGVSLWLGGGKSVEVEFRPYFFVPKDSLDRETEIKLRSKALRVEETVGYDPWFERKFLKVVGRDEEDLRRLARLVPDPWEYCIPTWQKFLLESNLRRFSIVVLEDGSPGQVGEGYLDDLK
ncbi:MAG: hypothetical protein QI223_04540, partial [Candidatus Korarchaeota archaeon]|nr:hypothetical protein [Candidatus Korarchaeota archaeon]